MYNSFILQLTVFLKHFKIQLNTLLKPLILTRHRLFLCLLITPLILLSACSSNNANAFNYYSITPDNLDKDALNPPHKRVNVLSSFLLKTKTKDSLPITELSGLAWDRDEQLLYAISDDGLLYHLTLDFKDKQLQAVDVVAAMYLRDKNNKPLKGKYSDSEGLTLKNSNNDKQGDSELIISFENKPRIAIHLNNGDFVKQVKTVEKLRKRKYFRSNNKALESVTLHPSYGILTASEKPLKENPLNKQTLYSSTGKEWHFAASKVKNSSITGLEVLSDGKILILERAYNGLLSPLIISLRRLNLEKCNDENLCEIEDIAKFSTLDGWLLDNFEGLTHFRNNQYLMVSDNNKNPLQKTILVLFDILDK